MDNGCGIIWLVFNGFELFFVKFKIIIQHTSTCLVILMNKLYLRTVPVFARSGSTALVQRMTAHVRMTTPGSSLLSRTILYIRYSKYFFFYSRYPVSR